MNTAMILSAIDEEIDRLTRVRSLLAEAGTMPESIASVVRRKPGRPAKQVVTPAKAARKRVMSAEGRARIVAAQKARWAKRQAESTAAKPAPSKSAAKKSAKKSAKKAAKKSAVKEAANSSN